MNQRDCALRYYDAGWQVMPCKDKVPILDSWDFLKDNRIKRSYVEMWWKDNPDAQIALICGRVSGVTVFDIDWFKDANRVILRGVGENPADLATCWCISVTSITGTGGRHVFCKYAPVKNSTKVVHPQVDVKSDGGYVIVPESIHHETRASYRWEPLFPFCEYNLTQLAEFPREFLETSKRKNTDWKTLTEGTGSGARNVNMTKMTGKIIRSFRMDEIEAAWNVIQALNLRNEPPLTDHELRNLFKSIAKAEYARRKQLGYK